MVHGTLVCTDRACLQEFPVVDGIPFLVPNVRDIITASESAIRQREDLPPVVLSLLGDCHAADSSWEQARQYLSIYARDHLGDFDPAEAGSSPAPGAITALWRTAIELAGGLAPGGPTLEVGCGPGRTVFEAATQGPCVGIDLNVSFLRLAQRVARRQTVAYERRRVGLVYDWREFPATFASSAQADFWAADACFLPFADDAFARVVALNVLDCVSSPFDALVQWRRVLRLGGLLILSTPYDWSPAATNPAAWLGGHSARGPERGASEPALRRALAAVGGLEVIAENADVPWTVRLHDRSSVTYRSHVVVARAIQRAAP